MALRREDYDYAVKKFAPALLRYLRRRFKCNEQDAEDLVLRAFVRAWVKRDTYEGSKPEDLWKWLWDHVEKVYLDRRRKSAWIRLNVQALKSGSSRMRRLR